MQRGLDLFRPWLSASNRHSFIVVGPEGCGKELLLRHAFEQLRSVQVAVIHCSAQTSAVHVIQKLAQVCMVISTNTGRVYRPRDSERLILYLKALNLPKPDKWGTSQLIAFLQQVCERERGERERGERERERERRERERELLPFSPFFLGHYL